MKPIVLFVLRTKAALLENFPVAHALQAAGQYEAVFLVDPGQLNEHVPMICGEKFRALHPSGKALTEADVQPSSSGAPSPLSAGRPTVLSRLKAAVFAVTPATVKNVWLYRSRLQRVRKLLQSQDIAAVVLSGDRQLGWEVSAIAEANKLGIPTLVTPYAIQFLESIAECRLRRDDYQSRFAVRGFYKQLVASLFPQWVYNYEGHRMFYYPPEDALAARLCGTMPANPWTVGGGAAACMAVESEYARQIFLADGVPEDKMVVTGKPCNDGIAAQMQSADTADMRRALGVPEGHRVLLCSLPQLGEHGLIPWEEHWKDIDWLLETFASFHDRDISTVISLHPKSDHEAYLPHTDKFNAVIAPYRIYELFQIADIFTAAVSSTVTQAIATHTPCVVEDIRGLDSRGYYDTAPGVTMVRETQDYQPALEKVLFDEAYYQQMVEQQQAKGSEWALMDGQCTERIVKEIDVLAKKRVD